MDTFIKTSRSIALSSISLFVLAVAPDAHACVGDGKPIDRARRHTSASCWGGINRNGEFEIALSRPTATGLLNLLTAEGIPDTDPTYSQIETIHSLLTGKNLAIIEPKNFNSCKYNIENQSYDILYPEYCYSIKEHIGRITSILADISYSRYFMLPDGSISAFSEAYYAISTPDEQIVLRNSGVLDWINSSYVFIQDSDRNDLFEIISDIRKSDEGKNVYISGMEVQPTGDSLAIGKYLTWSQSPQEGNVISKLPEAYQALSEAKIEDLAGMYRVGLQASNPYEGEDSTNLIAEAFEHKKFMVILDDGTLVPANSTESGEKADIFFSAMFSLGYSPEKIDSLLAGYASGSSSDEFLKVLFEEQE